MKCNEEHWLYSVFIEQHKQLRYLEWKETKTGLIWITSKMSVTNWSTICWNISNHKWTHLFISQITYLAAQMLFWFSKIIFYCSIRMCWKEREKFTDNNIANIVPKKIIWKLIRQLIFNCIECSKLHIFTLIQNHLKNLIWPILIKKFNRQSTVKSIFNWISKQSIVSPVFFINIDSNISYMKVTIRWKF